MHLYGRPAPIPELGVPVLEDGDFAPADLEREAAGADHRDPQHVGQAVDSAAHHAAQRMAKLILKRPHLLRNRRSVWRG